MDHLNFHHLHYFWMIVREGGVTKASDKLHVSQPTVSNQLKQLEAAVGTPLFRREGRHLLLTETGQSVHQYADEIFSLGRDLALALNGKTTKRSQPLHIGVVDALPKVMTAQLLLPVLRHFPDVRLICDEDHAEPLLARLALHQLDIVLSDSPVGSLSAIRAFDRLLSESPVALYGIPALVTPLQADFPHSLQHARLLLPLPGTGLRRSFDQWLDEGQLLPQVVAEVADSALIKALARQGEGLFVAPVVLDPDLRDLGFAPLGTVPGLLQRCYAITASRRHAHPAVTHLIQSAQHLAVGNGDAGSG
jgi:LysR family transcriptional activator of nhaA